MVPIDETHSALTFRLTRRRYVLPLDRTAGVRDLENLRRIPGAPRPWFGLTDWNGRVLNVLDLPHMLDDHGFEDARSIVRLRAPWEDLALFIPAHLGLAECAAPAPVAHGAPYTALSGAADALHWIRLDVLIPLLDAVAAR